ncbi:TPA: hypothetical protein ACF2D8_000242 [Serratia marcescens]
MIIYFDEFPFVEKTVADIALENIQLRNRAIIAENSLQQLSHRYDVDIRNQLNIRKQLESALSKAGARAIAAENELEELKSEQAKAVEILKNANANLGYVMKYLSKQIQEKHCSNCLERYCGNCAHANGAKVQ